MTPETVERRLTLEPPAKAETPATASAKASATAAAAMPLKVQLSIAWQRIVLTLRFAFRIPIDELREEHRANLDKQFAETLQNLAAILNQLNSRVSWYEHRVPYIRKEYIAFLDKQKQAMEKAQAAIDYEEREKRRAEMAIAQ